MEYQCMWRNCETEFSSLDDFSVHFHEFCRMTSSDKARLSRLIGVGNNNGLAHQDQSRMIDLNSELGALKQFDWQQLEFDDNEASCSEESDIDTKSETMEVDVCPERDLIDLHAETKPEVIVPQEQFRNSQAPNPDSALVESGTARARHHGNQEKCHVCHKSFSKRSIQRHIRDVHDAKLSIQETDIRCPLCPVTLKNKFILQRHIASEHVKERPRRTKIYQCSDCESTFRDRWHMNRHILGHHPDGFEAKELLKTSTSGHQCSADMNTKSATMEVDKDHYMDLIDLHIETETKPHNQGSREYPSFQTPGPIPAVRLDTENSKMGKAGAKRIVGREKCHVCNKSLSKRSMKRHMQDVHYTEPSIQEADIKCPLCPVTLKNKFILQRHISSEHMKERPRRTHIYQCSQCESTFRDRWHMNGHILRNHGQGIKKS